MEERKNTLIQRTAASQQIQQKNGGKPTIQQLIRQMEGEIKKALPSVITPERFTRITLSALSVNPKLGDCTPKSFLGAMMTAAQLGLEPNTPLGQAYLIPYNNRRAGQMECQFQLGYKGMIDLAYRSGNVKTIDAQVVYSNDTFNVAYGIEPKLELIPAAGDRGEPVAVYACFITKDGGYGFDVMSMEEVRKHARKYSQAYNNGPWQTNFEEMAKKTVLKRCLKYAPMSTDFVRGLSMDETTHDTISEDMFSEPVLEIPEEEYTVDETTGEVQEG